MEVNCVFKTVKWGFLGDKYTCKVNNVSILKPRTEITSFRGRYASGRSFEHVEALWFTAAEVHHVPRGLGKLFPNLNCMDIFNCGLKEVTREDLSEIKELKVLWLRKNKLEVLQDDLFADHPEMVCISFWNNQISTLGSALLDPLKKLRYADFSKNIGIDLRFDSNADNSVDLASFKAQVCEMFMPKPIAAEALPFVAEAFPSAAKVQSRKSVMDRIESIMEIDSFKDIEIHIANESFKAHKFVLAARSPTLRQKLCQYPDMRHLTITDMKVEAFAVVLDFMYNEVLIEYDGDVNLIEIYAAASRLAIKDLRAFTEETLLKEVTTANAFDVLLAAIKYDSPELKLKAFDEIKKMVGDRKLPDEMMNDPKVLEKIITAKKKFDDECKNVFRQ